MALFGFSLVWGNCLLQILAVFEVWMGLNDPTFYHFSTAQASFSFIWPLRLCKTTFIFANHLTHVFCHNLVVGLTDLLALHQIVCILNCGSFIFRHSSPMSTKFSQHNFLLFMAGLWFSWLHLLCIRITHIWEVNGNCT